MTDMAEAQRNGQEPAKSKPIPMFCHCVSREKIADPDVPASLFRLYATVDGRIIACCDACNARTEYR